MFLAKIRCSVVAGDVVSPYGERRMPFCRFSFLFFIRCTGVPSGLLHALCVVIFTHGAFDDGNAG